MLLHRWANANMLYKVLRRIAKNISNDVLTKKTHSWIRPTGVELGINVYDSQYHQNVPLILKDPHVATWYSCGPTVYDEAHIGHAFCYMKFDIIQRILKEFFNVNVIHQMGITDIDDKIIRRCQSDKIPLEHLTKKYELEFLQDLTSLNVKMPTILTRVTDYVPQIVSFIQSILDKHVAYVASDGSVYFDVVASGETTGFCQNYEVNEDFSPGSGEKKNLADFALWKGRKKDEPWWEAPWGSGRPGWHIECSAMASYTFGSSLDFHTGGIDLSFPHHNNELLQSSVFHGSRQWVNYWLHSGHLLWRNEKMSKSLKNTITIKDFLKDYSATDFRIFCLCSSLRHAVDFSKDTIAEAQRIYNQLQSFRSLAWMYVKGGVRQGNVDETLVTNRLHETRNKVDVALRENFNTHRAVDLLLDLVAFVSQQITNETPSNVRSPGTVAAVAIYVEDVLEKLGVQLEMKEKSFENSEIINQFVDNFVQFRHMVRQTALNKEAGKLQVTSLLRLCDEHREKLKLLGITVRDHKDHSSWNFTSTKPLTHEQSETSVMGSGIDRC